MCYHPSSLLLPDGAKLVYELFGTGNASVPLVLVGGTSNTRGDWDKLIPILSRNRQVLVYDHRGIGDSTFAPKQDDLSIEMLARDLVYLIQHLKWKQVAICGFSMGGIVTQQLLLLPHIPENPTPLPFHVTHVLLTATAPSHAFLTEMNGKYGLKFNRSSNTKKALTIAEKKAIVRPTVESTFDPSWLQDPANSQRLETIVDRMIIGRPIKSIFMQGKAMYAFSFGNLHAKLLPPPNGPSILVIHGKRDAIIPYSCADDLVQLIPHARLVETGPAPGQIDNLEFGHNWFEYFDAERWGAVIETFIKPPQICCRKARL